MTGIERFKALEARVVALELRLNRLLTTLVGFGVLLLIGKAARWW